MAVGERTTLNDLFRLIRDNLTAHGVSARHPAGVRDFRAGDVRHSADVSKAQRVCWPMRLAAGWRRNARGDAWYVGAKPW